jgi:hypothetical protein
LWPQARILAVLNQAGLQATLPLLGDLAERWATGGEDRQSLWRQAHELAGYILSTWPTTDWYPRDDAKPTEVARLLTTLTRLEDTVHIDTFMTAVVAGGGCHKGDNEAILGAIRADELPKKPPARSAKRFMTARRATLMSHEINEFPSLSAEVPRAANRWPCCCRDRVSDRTRWGGSNVARRILRGHT